MYAERAWFFSARWMFSSCAAHVLPRWFNRQSFCGRPVKRTAPLAATASRQPRGSFLKKQSSFFWLLYHIFYFCDWRTFSPSPSFFHTPKHTIIAATVEVCHLAYERNHESHSLLLFWKYPSTYWVVCAIAGIKLRFFPSQIWRIEKQ